MSEMINWSGFIGQTILQTSNDITGGLFLAMVMMLLFVIAAFFFFGVSLDLVAVFTLPILLGFVAFDAAFLPFLGLNLMYLGVVFYNNFLAR